MRADPPPGQSILDTDRTAEWNVLQAVAGDGSVSIAEPLYADLAGEQLGSPAFISENIEGDTLHVLANAGGDNRQYTERLAALIASVHAARHRHRLPADVERPTSWDDYVDRVDRAVARVRSRTLRNASRSCAPWRRGSTSTGRHRRR